MKKYTLTMGGLELVASGHSLKNLEVTAIQEYQKKNKKDLYQIGDGLSKIIGYNNSNTNMWMMRKGTKNESLLFTLTGTSKTNLSFGLKDIKVEPKSTPRVLNATPKKGFVENILLWIEEGRGSISQFTFESKTEPKLSDFTVIEGMVAAPDGNWDFIDKVLFKGKEIIPTLENNEISDNHLTVELWTL
tara:strand:- start:1784 stop:2350 length:567 start_codon:yes stop_codon:yes gene_type:complete